MTIEESPEFKQALNKACEKRYRDYLYGGPGIKAKTKSQIEGIMKGVQGRREKKSEKLRESLALRAATTGFGLFDVPSLPDEINPKSIERYHGKMQRYSRKVKVEAERRSNPHNREIRKTLSLRHGSSGGLVCPVCGEGNHGNQISGKPYCFMNAKHKQKGVDGPVPLMTPEKAKEWKPPSKTPRKSYTFNEPEGVTRKGVTRKR